MEFFKNKQFNYCPAVRDSRVTHVTMDSWEICHFSTIKTLIQAVSILKRNNYWLFES